MRTKLLIVSMRREDAYYIDDYIDQDEEEGKVIELNVEEGLKNAW